MPAPGPLLTRRVLRQDTILCRHLRCPDPSTAQPAGSIMLRGNHQRVRLFQAARHERDRAEAHGAVCHKAPLAMRRRGIRHRTAPAGKQDPRTLSARLARRLPVNLAYCLTWWRVRFGHLSIWPWSYRRRACPSLFRLFSCTSPGHHASLGWLLQSLQRRWRSFWWLSRNRPSMAWTRRPLAIGASGKYVMPISFCISSHSQHEPTALHWRK